MNPRYLIVLALSAGAAFLVWRFAMRAGGY